MYKTAQTFVGTRNDSIFKKTIQQFTNSKKKILVYFPTQLVLTGVVV